MKEGITIRAQTVDEAVSLALEHLGLSREEVEVEVLEEVGSGEEGVEEALVRVAPKAKVSAPQEELPPVESGEEILEGMIERMGFEVRITKGEYGVVPDETQPILEVTTQNERDSGLLIGRRGETLQHLQFLLNLMVSRRIHRWPYILVDVERYRQRRDASLRGLAQRMADRVSQAHEPITLEPMAAYERRIIHLTLRDDDLVVTQSIGEGDNRKVVIYPAGWELPPTSSS
jgi:spoIIIJ-associated protein